MKDIILGKGLNVEIRYPDKFEDLESHVLNSAVICQDLGTWSCKNVTFQNLACQVFKQKV